MGIATRVLGSGLNNPSGMEVPMRCLAVIWLFLACTMLAACDESTPGQPADGSGTDLKKDAATEARPHDWNRPDAVSDRAADRSRDQGLADLLPDRSPDQPLADSALLDQALPDQGALDQALPDLGPLDQALWDGAKPKAALQVIVSTIALPSSTLLSQTYAFDIDGDGKVDNGLGSVLGLLGTIGVTVSLDATINAQISSGTLLILGEFLGSSIVTDPNLLVQLHAGADTDSNPQNNLTGSGVLTVATGSPKNSILKGQVATGALTAGPADIPMLLPFSLGAALVANVKKAQMKGTLSSAGVANGVMGGAIPQTEVVNTLLPAVASQINHMYNDPLMDASVKATIKLIFDVNGDGVVSTAEVMGNALVTTFLAPDVDTDKNGTKDALSFGLGFTAVPCTIQ